MLEWIVNILLLVLGMFIYDVIKYYIKKKKRNSKDSWVRFL